MKKRTASAWSVSKISKRKVGATIGLTMALAFGAVPAFAADQNVEGDSPHDVPMPLQGTVKAPPPPETISVSMPTSITWAFVLDADGTRGEVQVPADQRIKNLDTTARVGAKITKVRDASNLLQNMSITLNGNTRVAGEGLDLDLGTAAQSGADNDSIPLALDAFLDHPPITPGEYSVVPTITLTRVPMA